MTADISYVSDHAWVLKLKEGFFFVFVRLSHTLSNSCCTSFSMALAPAAPNWRGCWVAVV